MLNGSYTIDELAEGVAENWDIPVDVARDHITACVAQIADDEALWDAEEERITRAGEYIIGRQLEDIFMSREADDAMADVRSAAAKVEQLTGGLDEAKHERDAKIRAALERGKSVSDLTEATGLSRERVYQIRDGRR